MMQFLHRSRSRSRVLALLLGTCLLPAAASADDPGDLWVPRGPECESDRTWSTRHQARTPQSRQDCTLALASLDHQVRVSHLRRGLSGAGFVEDRFGATPHPLAVAPVDELESKLELSGGHGLWSYETDFDIGREARVDEGRFLPEGHSRIQLQSGLDFGLLRSRVELKGMQREEERPFARGFTVAPGSTSELAAQAFVDVVLPHLPILTLGAGRAQKEVFRGRQDVGEQVDSDVTSAALWYAGSSWQAYAVSSRYVFRDDRLHYAPDGVYNDHFLSGSWWPSAHWTVNPSLQYSEVSYDGRESWTRTLRANLGLYGTGLWQNGLLTLWSGYSHDRDTAGSFDYQQLDLAVGVEHTLGELSLLGGYEMALAGTAGYSHYLDRLYPDASGPGYRASLTLRVTGP